MSRRSETRHKAAVTKKRGRRVALLGCLVLLTVALICAIQAIRPHFEGRTLYTGRLTLVADMSWTNEEVKKLRQIAQRAYPALVEVYGEPSGRYSLTVRKTSGDISSHTIPITHIRSGRFKIDAPAAIELQAMAFDSPGIFVHELAHAFHGRYAVALTSRAIVGPDGSTFIRQHDAPEEGMAQAAASIVCQRLGYAIGSGSDIDVSPGFNTPSLSYYEDMAQSPVLYELRLSTASWVFEECERREPGILRALNTAIYRTPEDDLPITWRDHCLKAIESLSPEQAAWLGQQVIFQTKVTVGPKLLVVGDARKVAIALYSRDKSGGEAPLTGQKVKVTISGNHGSKTAEIVTNQEGVEGITLQPSFSYYTAIATWGGQRVQFSYK